MSFKELKKNVSEIDAYLPPFKEVQIQFEKGGVRLLTKTIEDVNQVLTMECPKHGLLKTTWRAFRKEKCCPFCSQNGHNIHYIRKQIESMGYTLLSNVYLNASTELEFECAKHGKQIRKWISIRRSTVACKKCRKEVPRQNRKTEMSERDKELIGKRYGMVSVKNLHSIIQGKGTFFHCECDCGGEIVSTRYDLEYGRVKSCGCKRGKKKVARKETLPQ